MCAERSSTASSAYVVAAMNEILCATAACAPIGRPHCTRSRLHSRATFSEYFADAVQIAGIESRPVFSVVSAIFRPRPTPPTTADDGTRTWWKRVTPFSRPRRPMNELRRSTVTPGASASTTNAVMPPRDVSVFGTRAITTSSSATTPFVVHSLTPSRTKWSPSGVAVIRSRAGSEPTSGSVSRNALIAPRAQRGRYCRFCSSDPNSFNGSGTPIDWCALSSAPRLGCTVPMISSARL
jgi:hypothetical protein